MIYLINILTITIFSFLTLSVFPYIKIIGVVPLFVPFFLVTLTYFRKGFEPFILASFAGLYFDLFSSYPFGYYLALFLFLALLVRFTFQEGMRSLSFWYFFLFSNFFLFIYYGSQIIFLVFQKIPLSIHFAIPLLSGFAVNIVCVILVYTFSNWYFEKVASLEDQLKRR